MKKLIISIIALLGVMVPSITMAQGTGPEPYAVLSESNTKLTFYYNDNKPSDGMSVGPFSSSSYRDWNSYASTITSVVFDESFANCTSLESTAYWFYDCTNLASITGIEHLNTASVKNMNSMFYRCYKLTSLDVSGFNTSSATNMSFMFFNCSRLETLEVSNFDTSSAENISGMFYNCSGLTSLDVSHFNTANVTNMSGMFRDCRNLSSLDVSHFNTANVTNMSSMFYWCSGLTSLDVSGFNTDKVTKISAMFNGCSSLTTLNLSNFNTSNVSDLSEMFQGCLGLTSLDLSSFNTDNVTNMKSMFYNCSSLASLDLSGFNTAKVTTMEYMFGGCSSMTSLDLSDFVTNDVTNMSNMFSGCFGLTSLNVSSFNTASVTLMREMFKDCSSLPSINLSNFNTENVTNMYWMFGNCSSLTTINLSSFNTTNVIEMTSMFNGCSGLTSIDVSNFNTANVTNMGGLFSGCSGLTSLNLSNFNTNNVTNMAVLFNGCSGLTILDLNNLNTANVTNMSSMFNGCSGLTELDVSNFNTANVKDMTKMFYDCTSLTSIYVDDNWSTEAVTSSNSMFYNCSNLVGGKGTTYISPNYNATYARIDDPDNGNPGYLTDVADKGKVLEPYAVLTDNDDEITTDAGTIKGKTLTFYYDKQKETRGGMDLTYTPWRADETKEAITKVVFDASFADCTSLTTTDSWFNECSNLATIENISNLKTENVTNMSAMFRMCTSLTSIDFENINTSSATTLDNMFFGCTGLTNLDLSNFNTANVEDMHSMFAGCTKLTTLDLSHFETSSLTNIQGMFSGCELLETVDLSSWNTANVTDVRFLFNYCTSLTTVYVGSTWDLSSVTTEMGSYVFNNCNNIGGGQGTSYSSSHIDHTYARIDDPDNGNPGYFTDVADKYKVPEPYAVLKENGDEITTDDGTITGKTLTFYYDSKKKDSDFEIVPFSSESDRGWDSERGYITEVEFDASFANCKTLTSTAYWFSYCANLKKITHIEYLVTDDVENMAAMFRGCSDLTDLDFSHFNTANVKNMSELFHTGPKSLDLRSFDTRNVTDMSAMFYYSSVTSLDLSSFDTRNVENMNGMFIQCSSLSTLDLSNFETENVKNMASMFYRCTGLTSLNVSNFNTANVTTMKDMFKGCSHLTALDLGSFNTGNVKDMSEMFWDCGRLKTIFVSEWNTSALEEGKDKLMFEFSTSLVGGQGTKYSASYTDATYARIDNLPDNPGYFTRSGDEPYKAPEAYAVLSDNNTVLTFYYNKNKGEDAFDVKSFNSITDRGWNDVSSNITKVVFDASFAECTTLTSTAYWFEGFSSLTTFEGSSLVTSRVTNMIAMFSGCSSLTSLDLSSFNTVNVTKMTSMFQDCSNLQTISVGRDWTTKKSTNGNNMFSGCTSLVGGAGTSFNSSAVNHYYAHVDGGADNPGYFTLSADAPTKSPEPYALLSDDGKVLSIYYDDMKSSHIILNMISIDEGFMYNNIGWPYGTSQTVTTVIFDPSFADCRLKNLNSMFHGFNKLSEINGIEYLNTSEVTDMYSMFDSCEKLSKIDLSHFNTSNVTRMRDMFRYCTSLTTLNLSSFNTSKLSDISLMFFGDEMLRTIYVGSGWNTSKITDSNNLSSVFEYCEVLRGGKGTKYDASKYEYGDDIDGAYARIDDGSYFPGFFTDITEKGKENEPYAVLTENNDYVSTDEETVKGKTLTFYYDKNIVDRGGIDVGPFDSDYDRGWNGISNIITKVVFDDSFASCTSLTSTAYWFDDCQNLTSITGIERLNTDNVTDMNEMFWHCSSLTSLNVSNFNTSNVKNMEGMFTVCSGLKSIDISVFNTGKVTNMESMFAGCSSLTTIIVGSGWSTEAVKSSYYMFSGCSALVGGTGTPYDSSYEDATYARIDGGPDSDTPGYFTRGAEPEPYAVLIDNDDEVYIDDTTVNGKTLTFYYDTKKEARGGINIGPFGDNGERGWNDATSAITSVVFDNSFANYTSLTSTAYWFYHCHNLTCFIGIQNLKTSNVTDMKCMFYWCWTLGSLDVSGFNTDNVTDMSYLFYNCRGLANLDLSNFKTGNVTHMDYMFSGCSSLTNLDLSGFNTDNVTYMRHMFSGCSRLTNLDVSGFKTNNVIGMTDMFIDCSSLTSLDVSGFNTGNVTYMNGMFSGCSSLTSLDVTNFKTDNVTDMNGMFSGCSSLTSLDVSGFNTTNVTQISNMFSGCSSLTSLDVSGFKTDNVYGMNDMFSGCSSLTSLDVSGFKTDNVIGINDLFSGCSALTTVYVGEDWTFENLTGGGADVFKDCKALVGGKGTTFDANHTDYTYAHIDGGTDNPGYFTRSGDEPYKNPEPYAVLTDNDDDVTTDEGTLKQKTLTFYYDSHKESRGGMSVGPFALDSDMAWYNQTKSITTVVFDNSFANCTTLTSTAHWFERCSNISSILGIDNLKTDKVTNMARMFEYCSSLTSLDLSGFKTDNVTDMSCMFQGCSGLTNLDVTNFNTENVTDMSGMFGSCSGLTNLNVSGFKTDNVTDMSCMFSHCSSLKSLDLSGFNTESVTGMQAMFSGCSNLGTIYVGDKWNVSSVTYRLFVFEDCTALVGGAGTPYDPNHTDTEYARIDGGPDSDTPGYFTEKGPEAYAVLTDNEHVIYINEVPINGKTLTFYYDKNKTEREGMSVGPFETWTDRGWNDDRESITTVEFDTSFAECTTLKSTAYWFSECNNLTSITSIENLKTDNVENMSCMFFDCDGIGILDISGFNTEKLTTTHAMFQSCNFLQTIFVGEKWTTDNIPELGGISMFLGCDRLVGGQGTKYADNNIDNHTYAHIDEGISNPGYFTDIKSPYPYAVRSDENTKVTFYFDAKRKERSGVWIHEWKKYYESITQVIFDDSFAEYKGLTSLDSWFAGCPKLTSIEGISNLNTDNVLYMNLMFYNCTGLTSLDLSSLNTSKVNNMGYMFAGCSNLESLNMSFDTGNVTSMYLMFYGCSKLKNIDLSSFNTTNVENMSFMFDGCSSLTNLNLNSFNTENVTTINDMFEGCTSLKTLDLSSFNTSKVTYDEDNLKFGISRMFSGCSALTTIYVGEGWNIENLTESTDVFKDCTALVGGAGTPYDQNHTDIEYARIDDPDNSKPGYFTKAGKLGDVNGDGFVNIADAQAMVSYILGTYEGTFNLSLADMNNDGVIDIFDVTLVVNITLEDDTNNPSGSRAFTRGDNSQAEMIRLKAEANNIYLSIDEAERFTAFQFDITLPEGVELTGVELAAGTTDHMLKFVKHRGNRYRVVGLSFTNELLATSDGKLIMLQVSNAVSENDVSIDNVLFVTPSNKVVTHIGGIEYNQQAEDDTIYNLSGQKLNVNRQQLSKGVYIINHKKVIIK